MRLNNSKFYMLDNHFRQIVKAQFKFKFDHSKGVNFWVFFLEVGLKSWTERAAVQTQKLD